MEAQGSNATPNATTVPGHVDIADRCPDTDQCIPGLGNSVWGSTEPSIRRISETKVRPALEERQAFTMSVVGTARRGLSHRKVCTFCQHFNLPLFWDLPQLRIHELVGEEVGEVLGKAGIAACHLGTDRVEVHKPGLEQRPSHRLQRFIHAPVQLDLIVQRPQDVRDGTLFGEEGDGYWY